MWSTGRQECDTTDIGCVNNKIITMIIIILQNSITKRTVTAVATETDLPT